MMIYDDPDVMIRPGQAAGQIAALCLSLFNAIPHPYRTMPLCRTHYPGGMIFVGCTGWEEYVSTASRPDLGYL